MTIYSRLTDNELLFKVEAARKSSPIIDELARRLEDPESERFEKLAKAQQILDLAKEREYEDVCPCCEAPITLILRDGHLTIKD